MRRRGGGALPALAAVVTGLVLVLHVTATALYVASAPAEGPVAEAVERYVRPVLRQSWSLYAPDLARRERLLRVRAWVDDAGPGGSATKWHAFGHSPEQGTPWANVDTRRRNLLPLDAVRRLDDAEAALLRWAGRPEGDATALAADPASPPQLVAAYDDAVGYVVRLAAAELDPMEDRQIRAVQVEEVALLIPPPERATEASREIPVRRLPWWDVAR